MPNEIPDCWNYWEQEELCLRDLDEPIDSQRLLETDRIEQDESGTFHNEEMSADFRKWAEAGSWTAVQAAALTFGKDPEKLSKRIQGLRVNTNVDEEHLRSNSQFLGYLFTLTAFIDRAINAGSLAPRFLPLHYVKWAQGHDLSIPDALVEAVQEVYADVRELRIKNARLEKEMVSLRDDFASLDERLKVSNSTAGVTPRTSDQAHTINMLLKIVGGVAKEKYRYDPRRAKQHAAKAIADSLHKQGIEVDEQTVRNYLNKAAKMLDWPKPNSV